MTHMADMVAQAWAANFGLFGNKPCIQTRPPGARTLETDSRADAVLTRNHAKYMRLLENPDAVR